MSKKYKRVHPKFEQLERRALLAGILDVSVSDQGDLIIVGDDESNGFSVRALRRSGEFEIAPDKQTAIRGLPPGEPIVTRGVVRDLRLDLQDGNDQATVIGRRQTELRRLVTQSGPGNDSLQVEKLRLTEGLNAGNEQGVDIVSLSKLHVAGLLRVDSASLGGNDDGTETAGGSADVQLSDINITKYIDKSSPDLLLHVTNGNDVQMQKVRVEGDARIVGETKSNVALENSVVEGKLSVLHPCMKIWINRSEVSQAAFKFSELSSPDLSSEVEINSSKLDSLSIQSTGKYKFSMVDSSVSGASIHKHKEEIDVLSWSWGMSNSSSGPISIVSENAAVNVRVAGSKLSEGITVRELSRESSPTGETAAASSTSLTNSRIEGPVRVLYHLGGGGGAGKANFQDINVTKWIDKSSPDLMLHCTNAADVQLQKVRVEGDARFTTDGNAVVSHKNVVVEGKMNLSQAGGKVSLSQSEIAEATFKFFRPTTADASSNLQISSSKLGSLSVQSTGQHAFSLVDSKVAGRNTHKHKEEIDVLSWSWGMSNSSSGPISIVSENAAVNVRVAGSELSEGITVRELSRESSPTGENAAASSTSLTNSRIEGPVRVLYHLGGGGGAGKANFQDINVTKWIDKSSPDLMLHVTNSNDVQMQKVRVEGDVQIASGGKAIVRMNDVNSTRIKIKYIEQTTTGGGLAGGGTVVVENSSLGDISVTSQSDLEFTLRNSTVAGKVFPLVLDGLGHTLISDSRLGELAVSLNNDAPDDAAGGRSATSVVDSRVDGPITVRSLGGPHDLLLDGAKGEKPLEYLVITLKKAIITSTAPSSTTIRGSKLADVSVRSSGAGHRSTITDSTIRGSVSHQHKDEIDVLAWSWGMTNSSTGPLSISSTGAPVNAELVDSRPQSVRVVTNVPREDPSGESAVAFPGAGGVSIHGGRVDDALVISSTGLATSVALSNTRVGSVSIVSRDAPLRVGVFETRIDETFRLNSIGEDEDFVKFQASRIGGAVSVRLGGGSDQMQVHDSVFLDSVFLDGGVGENDTDVLCQSGNRFRVDPVFINWEIEDDCENGRGAAG